MSTRPTPPLSEEGIREIEAQLSGPPADTPERRATFERARGTHFLVEQFVTSVLRKGK